MAYNDLTYSNFPEQVSNMNRVQDVTASMKSYVDQYNSYYALGDFVSANQILNDHPELLRMIVNARTFNELRDEIIATQRVFRDDTESYIFSVLKNKGDWSNSTKYIRYNLVYYTVGTTRLPYLAIADNIPIGTLPTDINFWYQLAIKGDKGEPGTGLTPRGYWNDSTQYYQDDMIAYNNALWAATVDNLNYIPNDSSSVWLKMLSFSTEYLSYNNVNSGLTATNMNDAVDEVNAKVVNLGESANRGVDNTPIVSSPNVITSGGVKTALDNKSDTSHTHYYAGSSTVGGKANSAVTADSATTASSCTGNSATATSATKATQDSNGNNIVNTYATKASPIFSGNPTVSANTSYTTAMLRNVQLTTTDPTAGVVSSLPNGSIIAVYE